MTSVRRSCPCVGALRRATGRDDADPEYLLISTAAVWSANRMPFDGESMPDLLGVPGGMLPDPPTIVPDLPVVFGEAILRARHPTAANRFQTVRTIRRALLKP